MTNEEAVGVLYDSLGGRQDSFQEAFYIAINSIHENTKLKAEIEYWISRHNNIANEYNIKLLENEKVRCENTDLCEENAELKKDLETIQKQYCNVEALYNKYYDKYKKCGAE